MLLPCTWEGCGLINLSSDDLLNEVRDQLKLLQISAKSFDEGNTISAKDLSSRIRVLMHETRESHALLEQVGARNTMHFLDSAIPYDRYNVFSHHGLVTVHLDASGSNPRATYSPHLDRPAVSYNPLDPNAAVPYQWISCRNWWKKGVVVNARGKEFSRCDIVLYLANKDGGVHLDNAHPEDYHVLKTGEGMGLMFSVDGGPEQPVANVLYPSVRQIAYELIHSIQHQFPNLFSGDAIYY